MEVKKNDALEPQDVVEVKYTIKKYREVEKEHKAIEIIKKKNIDVYFLRSSETPIEYMTFNFFNRWKALTQEEFDLLKEVLKDD